MPGGPRVLLREARLGTPGAEWSRQVNEQGGGGTARPRTLTAPAARAQRARLGSGMGLAAAPPPTCWRRGAGAWGQPHSSQLSFRLLQRSETRPTSASSLSTFPTATFKLSLKTWGAPCRSGASPRGFSQPGEGARKKDWEGWLGGETRREALGTPGYSSPPAQATALSVLELTQLPLARCSTWLELEHCRSLRPVRRACGKSELGSWPPPLPSQFRQFGSRARSPSKFANRHSFRPQGCAASGARGRAPAKLERRPKNSPGPAFP